MPVVLISNGSAYASHANFVALSYARRPTAPARCARAEAVTLPILNSAVTPHGFLSFVAGPAHHLRGLRHLPPRWASPLARAPVLFIPAVVSGLMTAKRAEAAGPRDRGLLPRPAAPGVATGLYSHRRWRSRHRADRLSARPRHPARQSDSTYGLLRGGQRAAPGRPVMTREFAARGPTRSTSRARSRTRWCWARCTGAQATAPGHRLRMVNPSPLIADMNDSLNGQRSVRPPRRVESLYLLPGRQEPLKQIVTRPPTRRSSRAACP
jgi:hypothetical protein